MARAKVTPTHEQAFDMLLHLQGNTCVATDVGGQHYVVLVVFHHICLICTHPNLHDAEHQSKSEKCARHNEYHGVDTNNCPGGGWRWSRQWGTTGSTTVLTATCFRAQRRRHVHRGQACIVLIVVRNGDRVVSETEVDLEWHFGVLTRVTHVLEPVLRCALGWVTTTQYTYS